jgi:hypothetical protein
MKFQRFSVIKIEHNKKQIFLISNPQLEHIYRMFTEFYFI